MQEAAQCDRLVLLTAGQVTAAGTVPQITGGRTSLLVGTDRWQEAFTLLREAGLPVLLDGTRLRLPGAGRDEVSTALGPIRGAATIDEGVATLEESMLLDARAHSGRGHAASR